MWPKRSEKDVQVINANSERAVWSGLWCPGRVIDAVLQDSDHRSGKEFTLPVVVERVAPSGKGGIVMCRLFPAFLIQFGPNVDSVG